MSRHRRLLLTTREAAEALDITMAAIRKWRERGLVTPITGSERHPRWDLADLRQAQITRHGATARHML